MHYEIDYNNLEEPAKSEKALKDIQDCLGGKRQFNKVTKAITGMPKKTIIASLSLFVGIEGYPAQVLADKYGKAEVEHGI